MFSGRHITHTYSEGERMKVYKALFVAVLLGINLCAKNLEPAQKGDPMKKVLIFTSSGGGGHMSVVKAISEALDDKYDIKVAHGFRDVLSKYDFIRYLTFNKADGERFYNFIVRHNLYYLANAIYTMAVPLVKLFGPLISNTLANYIKEQKADLVISVVPVIDAVLAKAAQKAGVPFLIVPSDMNSMAYTPGLKVDSKYPFTYTRSFDSEDIWQTIRSTGLKPKDVKVTGFPVRKDFLKQSFDKVAIRREFNIPSGKPIVLVMMGAQGSKASVDYLKALAKITTPIHLILCLGKTADMWRDKINKIPLPKTMSITPLGFTKKIPELMVISDVFITKPGGLSTAEGIYAGIPLILDRTMPQLLWERFNHGYVKRHGFGESVENLKDLPKLIKPYLSDTPIRKRVQANLKKVPKLEFGKEIRKIVDAILHQPALA